jgi:hypothetical protein
MIVILVHGVHLRSHLSAARLFPVATGSRRPRSQSKPECFVGGTGAEVSLVLRNLPAEPTKQNEGNSRVGGFKPAGALDNGHEESGEPLNQPRTGQQVATNMEQTDTPACVRISRREGRSHP